MFVGYPKESIGYLFYHPTDQNLFVSKHVTFIKKVFILERGIGKKIKLGEVQNLQMQAQDEPQLEIFINEVPPQNTPPLRRLDRVRNAPIRYGFIVENNEAHIIENDDPLTYLKVVRSRNLDKWLEAIKFEIDFMYANQV